MSADIPGRKEKTPARRAIDKMYALPANKQIQTKKKKRKKKILKNVQRTHS